MKQQQHQSKSNNTSMSIPDESYVSNLLQMSRDRKVRKQLQQKEEYYKQLWEMERLRRERRNSAHVDKKLVERTQQERQQIKQQIEREERAEQKQNRASIDNNPNQQHTTLKFMTQKYDAGKSNRIPMAQIHSSNNAWQYQHSDDYESDLSIQQKANNLLKEIERQVRKDLNLPPTTPDRNLLVSSNNIQSSLANSAKRKRVQKPSAVTVEYNDLEKEEEMLRTELEQLDNQLQVKNGKSDDTRNSKSRERKRPSVPEVRLTRKRQQEMEFVRAGLNKENEQSNNRSRSATRSRSSSVQSRYRRPLSNQKTRVTSEIIPAMVRKPNINVRKSIEPIQSGHNNERVLYEISKPAIPEEFIPQQRAIKSVSVHLKHLMIREEELKRVQNEIERVTSRSNIEEQQQPQYQQNNKFDYSTEADLFEEDVQEEQENHLQPDFDVAPNSDMFLEKVKQYEQLHRSRSMSHPSQTTRPSEILVNKSSRLFVQSTKENETEIRTTTNRTINTIESYQVEPLDIPDNDYVYQSIKRQLFMENKDDNLLAPGSKQQVLDANQQAAALGYQARRNRMFGPSQEESGGTDPEIDASSPNDDHRLYNNPLSQLLLKMGNKSADSRAAMSMKNTQQVAWSPTPITPPNDQSSIHVEASSRFPASDSTSRAPSENRNQLVFDTSDLFSPSTHTNNTAFRNFVTAAIDKLQYDDDEEHMY
jgi:hypothetical protein